MYDNKKLHPCVPCSLLIGPVENFLLAVTLVTRKQVCTEIHVLSSFVDVAPVYKNVHASITLRHTLKASVYDMYSVYPKSYLHLVITPSATCSMYIQQGQPFADNPLLLASSCLALLRRYRHA
jgi:hypothetical protein